MKNNTLEERVSRGGGLVCEWPTFFSSFFLHPHMNRLTSFTLLPFNSIVVCYISVHMTALSEFLKKTETFDTRL